MYAARSIARSMLGQVRRPIAERNFKRAMATHQGPLRICAGAGKQPLEGWFNTDVSWHAQNYLNLLKPWRTPPGTVTHIYMDNVIEHFTLHTARKVLANAYDALAPGGAIRLATPDVERAARLYLENGDFVDQALARNRRAGYDVHYPVDLLRIMFAEADHHLGFLWDEYSLSAELVQAGFEDVQRYAAGESDDAGFKGLESRTGPEEVMTTLVLEARKH